MALSLPGVDGDLLAKIKTGDLGALEKLFRSIYPILLGKAKESLDDDSAASRVVERLVPRLFADRSALTTPQALGEMLEGAVHDASVRERSRLAGVRKHGDVKKSTVVPTVDEVWGRVLSAVQGPTAEARVAAEQMKDKLRHEAAGHIKQMTATTPLWKKLATGLTMVGAVAAALYFFAKSGEEGRLARQVNAMDIRELKTGVGQRGDVTMDDSSTAMFGADTRVKIPSKFGEMVRGVGLEGVAEFRIKADEKPFQVLAKNILVTATGTEKFAMRAYPSDNEVILRVKEGTLKVEIESPVERELTLTAGQSVVIKADGTSGEPAAGQLEEAFGYIDGNFTVDNKSLKQALAEVKKWYGTELFLKDTTLGTRVVSVKAPLTSSTDAIKALETASNLVFGWEGQTMVLKEKGK